MKRIFCFVLARCICLGAGCCLAEGDAQYPGITGPYHWLGYELNVQSVQVAPGGELFSTGTLGTRFVKEDNRILSQIKETMLQICLTGGEDGVAFADLTPDNIQQFVLKDENGEEIPLYCWSWWGVGYSDEKGFGSYDQQEGFFLFYFLPDGVAPETLTLTVETPAE